MKEDSPQNTVTYPRQKLSYARKTDSWRRDCVNYFIFRSNLGYTVDRTEYTGLSRSQQRNRIYNMLVNYDIYNSRFLRSDIEYIVNPYGQDEEQTFPTMPQNVNITRPAIDELIGEKASKMQRPMVLDVSPEMVTTMGELKKELMMQNVMAQVENYINPESDQQVIPLDKINEYIHYRYKNIYEKAGQFIVNTVYRDQELYDKFIEVWKDALIAGEQMMFVGSLAGKPVVERLNPTMCDYERHPGMSRIEEAGWFVEKMYMSPYKCLETWDFTDKEVSDLLQELGTNNVGYPADGTIHFIRKKIGEDTYYTSDVLPVYRVIWRSMHQVGFTSFINQDGEIERDIVGEGYKPRVGETIEWQWEEETWMGYKIGKNTFKDVAPIPTQLWPVIGNIMSNTNSDNVSLVGLMKPLQYFFIEVMYRLQLTMARDKGKIINIDATQIPKSLGIDFKTWAHYLSFLGINIINPYEEGWDINRQGPAQFNQFGSVDLTMANVINEYIMLLGKIESMIGRISGVPDQRLGSVKASELVGNVERSIIQSSMVTEPLFVKQQSLERRVYEALLETAKKMAYVGDLDMVGSFDDVTREFISIPEDFSFRDLGVFVSNSQEDYRTREAFKQMGRDAVAAGATLFEAATMFTTESVAEIRAKLKEIDERKQQAEQQQNQLQMQLKQQELEYMASEAQKDRDNKFAIEQLKSNTEIEVALLKNDVDTDTDDNGTDDTLDLAKIELQRQKIISDMVKSKEDLAFKKEKLREDIKIKEKQLRVKNKTK